MKLKFEKTSRGFRRADFQDLFGGACSLQESSLATEAAIWFGRESEEVHHVTGEKLGARMHLTQEQVRDMLPALQHFAETGELPDCESKP